MKKFTIALGAALAVASIGVASATDSPAVSLADGCASGWYWNSNTNRCLPDGWPSDPPNGCLTANGSHVNGTICAS